MIQSSGKVSLLRAAFSTCAGLDDALRPSATNLLIRQMKEPYEGFA